MGVFDTVLIEKGIKLPGFKNPSEVKWQTKSLGNPLMRTFKISSNGRLLQKKKVRRELTKGEKQELAKDEGYNSWEEMKKDSLNILNQTVVLDEVWTDYHDTKKGFFEDFYYIIGSLNENNKTSFKFSSYVNDEQYEYEAIFRYGKLQSIKRISK